MTVNSADAPGAQRQCAPCAAAFFAALSVVFGPVSALITVAITVYVFANDAYSRVRRVCTAAACLFALTATAVWISFMMTSGL